jgi:hypothetical protein
MGIRQTWLERSNEIELPGWVCKAIWGFIWDGIGYLQMSSFQSLEVALNSVSSSLTIFFPARVIGIEYLLFHWNSEFITWFLWTCGLKWERPKSKKFLLYFIYLFIFFVFFSFSFFLNTWVSPSEHDSSRNSSERRWFWWLFLGLARRPILLA